MLALGNRHVAHRVSGDTQVLYPLVKLAPRPEARALTGVAFMVVQQTEPSAEALAEIRELIAWLRDDVDAEMDEEREEIYDVLGEDLEWCYNETAVQAIERDDLDVLGALTFADHVLREMTT